MTWKATTRAAVAGAIGLLVAAACGGRTTIDFVEPGSGDAGGADSGAGGIASGGAGGTSTGGSAGTSSGGSGGVAPVSCAGLPDNQCGICTCDNCEPEWDDCATTSGCLAILECAWREGCSGPGCLIPCGQVIQANGGITGEPASVANQIGECINANNCPCSGSGGSGGAAGSTGSGGTGGGGPLDCLSCIQGNCPEAQQCLFDQACRNGAICAFTDCLGGGGGGLDFQCLLGCFNGDLSAAMSAFQAVQCVIAGPCADPCGGLLGGLPGGGGFP